MVCGVCVHVRECSCDYASQLHGSICNGLSIGCFELMYVDICYVVAVDCELAVLTLQSAVLAPSVF